MPSVIHLALHFWPTSSIYTPRVDFPIIPDRKSVGNHSQGQINNDTGRPTGLSWSGRVEGHPQQGRGSGKAFPSGGGWEMFPDSSKQKKHSKSKGHLPGHFGISVFKTLLPFTILVIGLELQLGRVDRIEKQHVSLKRDPGGTYFCSCCLISALVFPRPFPEENGIKLFRI